MKFAAALIGLATVVAASDACLEVRGDRITAADLARAVPAFGQLPAETVISYAPVPGHVRLFRAAELAQRIRGATDLPESVCFEWRMRSIEPEEARAVMLSQLPAGSEVTVLESSAYPAPEGQVVFPLSGISNGAGEQRAWRGFVEYAPGRKFDVYAKVVVNSPFRRVTPIQPIRAGERITADLLRVETGAGLPLRGNFATEPEQVIGQTSRRLLPAGSPIPLGSLEKSAAVARGDAMQVHVISGQALIRFDGIAQATASDGELVPVRMRDNGRIVHARVDGAGRAVLDLNAPAREKM